MREKNTDQVGTGFGEREKKGFRVGRKIFLECTEDHMGGPWGYLELWESWQKIRGGPGT